MTKLVAEILADYGTVPMEVGRLLGKRNASTMEYISRNTLLTRVQVVHGLSLLIQRRLVRYFQYERKVHYVLDVEMVHRRMFYAIYCRLIEEEFGEEAGDEFMMILAGGFTKSEGLPGSRIANLVDAGVVRSVGRKEAGTLATASRSLFGYTDKEDWGHEGTERKSRKTSEKHQFWIVDFDALDTMVASKRLLDLVRRRYFAKAERVYKSILGCSLVTVETIMSGLEDAMDISRKDVTSCIKYFTNCGLIKKSLDCTETYFKDSEEVRRVLAVDSLSRILGRSGLEARRVFNMMLEYKALEDKDVIVKSLIPSGTIKRALLMLHSNGLVILRHSAVGESKPVLQWQVDIDRTSRIVAESVRKELEDSWATVNRKWRYMRPSDDLEEDEGKDIGRMLGLSQELFVLRAQV